MQLSAMSEIAINQIRGFVMQERLASVSDREWRHRLHGYGYDICQTEQGRVLTTFPHGRKICTLEVQEAYDEAV
jgi:hypothetical protein